MSYISKNRGFTYGLKTLAEIQAITGMQTGDTCYCTEHFRVFTYDGSFWLPDDCIVMRNRDASTIAQWDVVSVQNGGTTTEISCVRSSVAGDDRVVGVAIYSALTGNNCVIAIKSIGTSSLFFAALFFARLKSASVNRRGVAFPLESIWATK